MGKEKAISKKLALSALRSFGGTNKGEKNVFQLSLASRVTSTVISVVYSEVALYNYLMTLKDLRLGFSKNSYLQRSTEMVSQGKLLKLPSFPP